METFTKNVFRVQLAEPAGQSCILLYGLKTNTFTTVASPFHDLFL